MRVSDSLDAAMGRLQRTGCGRATLSRIVSCVVVVLFWLPMVAHSYDVYRITDDPVSAGHPSWSPDGTQIAFQSEASGNADIWIIPANGGTPTQITTNVADDVQPDWSPDGQTLVFCSYRSDNDGDIWTYHLPTATLSQLTTYDGSDWTAKWSPDGLSMAFVSDRGGSLDIWTMSANGGGFVQVTDDPSTEWGPAWSPDGGSLAFVGFMSGNNDLWTISSDGTGVPHQVTTYSGHDLLACWSPDGSRLAFGSDRDGTLDIWTIPDTGGTATQITSGPSADGNPDWSPDGSRIAIESDRDGSFQVWVVQLSQFTRVTTGEMVNDGGGSWGVCWPDYDNDGFPDLFVSNMQENNCLYHNEGDGTFSKITDVIVAQEGGAANITSSTGATWCDLDNDGDLDAYVSNAVEHSTPANYLYLNDGDGTFTKISGVPVTDNAGNSVGTASVDFDNDGDLDIFAANHPTFPPSGAGANCLFRNDNGDFVRLANSEIGFGEHSGESAAFADYDNDGDPDVFVPEYVTDPNYLYQNDLAGGGGGFTQIIGEAPASDGLGVYSLGASWADYDNDGDLDLFVANSDADNFMYENLGSSFSKVTGQEIVTDGGGCAGSAWGDYDNDGDLDLFLTRGGYFTPATNQLWNNNGSGEFTRVTEGVIATDVNTSMGAAWADYDRDGDLDLFVANCLNLDEDNVLYRNDGNTNGWINIKCVGVISNRSAIGAKVRLLADMGSVSVWQMREISGQTGKAGQNSLNVHFGLGDAAIIDSIRVEWPSGMVQVLTDVDVNQFLTIEEACCGLYTGGYTGNTNCSTDGRRNL